jgi:SAM-dependent methyltransferase
VINIKILDIGCGKAKYPNSIGLDYDKYSDADIVYDCNKTPYPFKKNHFDVVIMNGALEHLSDTVKVMKEVYRILKPDGRVFVRVPHFSSIATWGSPDHERGFALNTFHCFDNKYDSFGLEEIRFRVVKERLRYLMFARGNYSKNMWHYMKVFVNDIVNFLANLNTHFCERFWCYYVGGMGLLDIELRAIKKGSKEKFVDKDSFERWLL